MWLCITNRLRSAQVASVQCDQRHRCPHEKSLGPNVYTKRTTKTLIRLIVFFLEWSYYTGFTVHYHMTSRLEVK